MRLFTSQCAQAPNSKPSPGTARDDARGSYYSPDRWGKWQFIGRTPMPTPHSSQRGAQNDSDGKRKLGMDSPAVRTGETSGFRPPIRSTIARSTSTATDRCNISTDRRSLHQFFWRTKMPSSPRSGPALTLTRSPHLRKGCGSALTEHSTTRSNRFDFRVRYARRLSTKSHDGVNAGSGKNREPLGKGTTEEHVTWE